MQTIRPMMPRPLGVEPEPTLGPVGTMFCTAVTLLLVVLGTLGQADDATNTESSCEADVLVIPAGNQDAKPCINCGGRHVAGDDGSIPCVY